MLICCFSFFLIIITTTARQIHIIIRDNVTQSCPGQHFDLIDQKTINVHFDLISLVDNADQLFITGQNGNTKTLTLPGCFRAKINFQLKELVNNPYIESFIQLGTNIPCKAEEDEISRVKQICTNITQENWCPQSDNQKLRSMLNGKSTCKFCNLCQPLKIIDGDAESYIENEKFDQCNSTSTNKTFVFKICMPSPKQLRERNLYYNGRLEEYWNYLKQGILTAVVHVMDRPQLMETRLQQCKRLCRTYENYLTISESYRTTLTKTIEKLCVPIDSYVACIYHTVKFDVIDN